jgi:methylmalonyl-CoA mutase cobalamin-binding subunit
VASVIERIGPSTCAASSLDGAIRDHVEQTVVKVREWTANSPQILVVGGVYEIRSGQVLWLESCSPTTC